MSSASNIYEPAYASSHALVIGINNYRHVSPLARAANDAKAVAKTLIEKFGFPTANVSLLIDDKATRAKITKEYLSLANSPKVSINDRVIIFFAGHGHTVSGRRETGFLVPVDGKIDDLATLVRWDELTRNADLIPAKHILFLMDACYGGLAVTRKIPPGSSRYLEDMLTRLTRQVVTAGKANETVSDGGGTRPDHSIFTSNLLDALDGAAASTPGVITAMGVMAYVYEKVGNDPNSNQTPHFGFIDGDGDLIFQMPEREIVGTKGYDTLIKAPQFNPADEVKPLSVGEQIKLLVPDQSARIRLDDFVTSQLRTTLQAISPTKFPSQGQPVSELPRIFADYVGQYEKEVRNIQTVLIQLCRWAEPGQLPLIQRIFQTIGEQPELRGGFTMLANLDWYPSACSMYAGGISALAAGRFDSLRACMLTEVKEPSVRGNATKPIIVPVGYAIAELGDSFKTLPDMAQRYTARSDHLLTAIQPVVEDEIFLGRRYEETFDQFEIMLALVFADVKGGLEGRIWGPPGRFAWKENGFNVGGGPFSSFVENAKKQGQSWPALKAGFFRGSHERFAEVAEGYKELIGRLNWF